VSSAILYLAIVAIWAIVLVPRWLHPRSSLHRPSATLQNDLLAPRGEENEGRQEAPGGAEAPAGMAPAAPDRTPAPDRTAAPDRTPAPDRTAAPPAPAGLSPASRRKRMLQARRRTLGTLVLLTLGAVVLAVAHLAAAWMIAPPALILAGFLVLLREAALIDAERRQRRIRARHSATGSGAEEPGLATGAAPRAAKTPSEPVAPVEQAAGSGSDAHVIDLSERIDGQFYDQYTDAVDRAVGD
jgi:hypothetical protein